MEALDLIVLGRRLTRIGEQALRGGTGPAVVTGIALVLRDVFAHPDTTIGEIAARTGLPQGYVSESVAHLRVDGSVETGMDPGDARRTLVRVTEAHARRVADRGAISADVALADALGEADPRALADTLAFLAALSGRLRLSVGESGAILGRLARGRDRGGRTGAPHSDPSEGLADGDRGAARSPR